LKPFKSRAAVKPSHSSGVKGGAEAEIGKLGWPTVMEHVAWKTS
jgi:hypothetical protein